MEKGYDIIALQEVNQLMSAPAISPTLKQDNYGVILLNKINQRVAQKYSLFWSNSHIGYDKYDEGIAFFNPFACLLMLMHFIVANTTS